MPDDTTGTEGQVPQGTEPTPDQPTTEPQQPAPEPQDPQDEPFDRERALNTIRKLRGFEKTAEQLRRELADYQRKDEEAQRAAMSEQERLRADLKKAEAEREHERQVARDRINQYEVQLHASRLGIVDPDAAVKLLDWGALNYDDDGRPDDIEGALKDLLETRPYLAAQPSASPRSAGSPTNPATRTPQTANRRYTTAEIADRAFWTANKDDIMRAIKEGRIAD